MTRCSRPAGAVDPVSGSGKDRPRILVIKLGALGDVVQALGPMRAIRDHHADAEITILTTAPFAELLTVAGVADAVWTDTRPRALDLGGWLSLRRRLRGGNFTRVYDLQTSDRSSGYFRLFWPGPYPAWSGIAKGCSHPHANPNRDFMHTVERQAEQLAVAGIADVPAPSLADIESDVSKFALAAPYALIAPGGAPHRPEKRWPAENFREIARSLAATGVTPVAIGGAAERTLCEEALAGVPGARNLAGETSLIELVGLARGASLALGNDTGPMHIAAVAGVPTVVLYSNASDPALCAQRGPKVTILRRERLADLTPAEVMDALPHP